MTKSTNVVPLARDERRAPVKVKLERVNCDYGRPCPPDDVQGREWCRRLKQAFATISPDFIEASLNQLIMAARPPGGGLSETAVNAALAFIEGAKPPDEVEAALVIQMACTHSATMLNERKQVGRAPCEPVELCHDEHIAFPAPFQRCFKLGSLPDGADLLREELLASRPGEGVTLRLETSGLVGG